MYCNITVLNTDLFRIDSRKGVVASIYTDQGKEKVPIINLVNRPERLAQDLVWTKEMKYKCKKENLAGIS